MNKRKKKYIVFDFDGVVCDSTNECMVTSWNTWKKWNNLQGFRRNLEEFRQVTIDTFKPLRPYVRGAGEYYILMRAINSSDVLINNQNDFDNLCNKWKGQLKLFKELFLDERNRLRKENMDSWIGLHEVYDDVITVMKELHNQKRLLIATLKDGESVRLILEKQGIDISPKSIYDQSQISSKIEALDRIISEKKVRKNELLFLDDNITHLIDPYQNGYNVLLTGWGNTLEEHKETAKKENIVVLEQIIEREF